MRTTCAERWAGCCVYVCVLTRETIRIAVCSDCYWPGFKSLAIKCGEFYYQGSVKPDFVAATTVHAALAPCVDEYKPEAADAAEVDLVKWVMVMWLLGLWLLQHCLLAVVAQELVGNNGLRCMHEHVHRMHREYGHR